LAHDVFISYATPDKQAADAVCATLEQRGIRCCIFPRDGIPGRSFAATIAEFLGQCRAMVLVFSSHANVSKHISREVEMAVRRGLTVIPFRIENVQPTGSLEYWIAQAHWLDALTPEMERGLQKLAEHVRAQVAAIDRHDGDQDTTAASAVQYRTAVIVAWADGRLDAAEVAQLRELARELDLDLAQREALEREVMGDTLAGILESTEARAAAAANDTTAQTSAPRRSGAFCRKCGQGLVTSAKFCRHCGTPVPRQEG
jgi:hypothetical protein